MKERRNRRRHPDRRIREFAGLDEPAGREVHDHPYGPWRPTHPRTVPASPYHGTLTISPLPVAQPDLGPTGPASLPSAGYPVSRFGQARVLNFIFLIDKPLVTAATISSASWDRATNYG